MSERVCYWDSSALIKRYLKEGGSAAVIGGGSDAAHFTASLSHAEICATFYRLRREGRISQSELDQLLRAFFADWAKLLVLEYGQEVRGIAEKSIAQSPLKGADLVHLSSALLLQREGFQVVLWTFDRQLEKAAHDHDLSVLPGGLV